MDLQLEKQRRRLQDYILVLQSKNKSKHDQKISLEGKIKILSASNKQLKMQYEELDNKIKFDRKIHEQITQLQSKIMAMQSQISAIVQSNNQTTKVNTQFTQNINILKENQKSSPSLKFQDQLAHQYQQIHQLQQQKSELEQHLLKINNYSDKSYEQKQMQKANNEGSSDQDKQKQNIQYIASLYESEVKIKQKIIEHLENKLKEYEKEIGNNPNSQKYNAVIAMRRTKIQIAELENKLDLSNQATKNLKKRIRQLEAESVGQNLALARHNELTFKVEKQKMLFNDKVRSQDEENMLISNLRANLSLLEQKIRDIKTKARSQQSAMDLEKGESSKNLDELKKQIKQLKQKALQSSPDEIKQQIQLRVRIQKQNEDLYLELKKAENLNKFLIAQIQRNSNENERSEITKLFQPKHQDIQLSINSLKQQIKIFKESQQLASKDYSMKIPILEKQDKIEFKKLKQIGGLDNNVLVYSKSKSFKQEQKIEHKNPLNHIEEKIKKLKLQNKELKTIMLN